jgi:hypothetical protein
MDRRIPANRRPSRMGVTIHGGCGANTLSYTDYAISRGMKARDRAVCQLVGRPCEKCGINICEECRFFPHFIAQPFFRPQENRPIFFDGCGEKVVMAMCASCDEQIEELVSSTYPDSRHVCDCDLFNRWVCFKCRQEEEKEGERRYNRHWNDPSRPRGPTTTKEIRNWPFLNVTTLVRDLTKPGLSAHS